MRTIKFKCWDKELNRFVIYEPHISIDLNGNIYNLQNGEGRDRYELVQFTGLLDRRGREIYEGDIYQYPIAVGYHEDTDEYEFGAALSIVEYSTFAGRPAIGYRFHAFSKDCEVVGNIYENPELIKQ